MDNTFILPKGWNILYIKSDMNFHWANTELFHCKGNRKSSVSEDLYNLLAYLHSEGIYLSTNPIYCVYQMFILKREVILKKHLWLQELTYNYDTKQRCILKNSIMYVWNFQFSNFIFIVGKYWLKDYLLNIFSYWLMFINNCFICIKTFSYF